jgi:pyridoxal phosphate enzyme (YggS family)
LIGHLQRNKVRTVLPHITLIHSVDSERLLTSIDNESERIGTKTKVLLEVNVSREPAKHGFTPDELAHQLQQFVGFEHVEICGLMAMAGRDGGADRARRDFSQLRDLREKTLADCPSCISLDELSMGMSGDFEIAIEEGATIVRVGSALFDGIA